MSENYLENEFAKFYIENGILYFHYKENVNIDLDAAKKIVTDRLNFQQDVEFPVFVDSRGIESVSRDARNYMAQYGSEKLSASALLINSPVQRIIGEFFLKINKPEIPYRLFTNKDKALEWLQDYK